MGGKGGGGGPSRDQMAQQAYQAGQSGTKWSGPGGVHEMSGGGGQDLLDAWMAGGKARQPAPSFEFPEFAMPEMPMSDSGSYEERLAEQRAYQDQQYAKQQAALKAQEEARLRTEGLNRRDMMFSSYMDAAGSATDFVNAEIDREVANARLYGIDYNIDDEQKQTRISDYFATLWGEGQQAELEGLFDKWGKPTGFTDWTIKRGDGSAYAGADQASEAGVSTSKPLIPTPLTEEEDTLGANENLLGV